jgi:UDP-N-acetylmuramate--alanine ligase
MVAKNCGWKVNGSDLISSPITDELSKLNINFRIGEQDDKYILSINSKNKIDYFVHSSAIKDGNPELEAAKKQNIKCIKRDYLINLILKEKKLNMVAVAGTHGKTTTTAMIAWISNQLNIPVSYSIGSTINFGPSGKFDPASQFFIYEADEYDKNFLNFSPYLSVITNVDYDHPDIYPTKEDYRQAFQQFKNQSQHVIELIGDQDIIPGIKLNGIHNRLNASLSIMAVLKIYPELKLGELIDIINHFPGTGRRMEKLAPRIYSDYAHTPTELKASMQMLREMFDNEILIAIYQPHQNLRQIEILNTGGYTDCLSLASKIYWLPTYLTRENSEDSLSPAQLIASLSNSGITELTDMNEALVTKIKQDYAESAVIIFFGAGFIDTWARTIVEKITK